MFNTLELWLLYASDSPGHWFWFWISLCHIDCLSSWIGRSVCTAGDQTPKVHRRPLSCYSNVLQRGCRIPYRPYMMSRMKFLTKKFIDAEDASWFVFIIVCLLLYCLVILYCVSYCHIVLSYCIVIWYCHIVLSYCNIPYTEISSM